MGWGRLLLCAGAALFGGAAAAADDDSSARWWTPATPSYIVMFQEVRVGVFAHDINNPEHAPVDLSFETLSSNLPVPSVPNFWLDWFLHPRIALGAMMNTGGGASYAFGSFNWRIPIYQKFYFEGEFGGAVDNRPDYRGPNRLDLGCPVTFRESVGFGVQLTPNWDATASIEHISHATLCTKKNEGVSDVGIRIGYKF